MTLVLGPSQLVNADPGGPTAAPAEASTSQGLLPVPDAASIASIGAAAPADPFDAAAFLAGALLGPDPAQAGAAAAEILRRAGIPVVSGDGPVLAWPDDLVISGAPIYVEWTADLARAVRLGDGWTLTELVDGLKALGYLPAAARAGDVGAALADWGKRPDDPVESVFAAAVVRNLAASRRDVLVPDADPEQVRIDPLQWLLVLAHLSGDASVRTIAARPAARSALGDGGRALAMLQSEDPCAALAGGAKTVPGQAAKDVLKDSIKDAIKKRVGKGLADQVGYGVDVADKALDVVSLALLLMGTRLELSTDRGETHFKHAVGDRSGHVHLRALATFSSSLAQERLSCYKLAGIKVPPNGPIAGFKVGWMLTQKQGSYSGFGTGTNPFPLFLQGKYLTVVHADSPKICARLSCGETTGSSGLSTLELYPPVEKKPDKGAQLYGSVGVRASLSKEDIPRFLKITDPKSVLKQGAEGKPSPQAIWAIKKIVDLAISYLNRAGLPSQSLSIRVGYHGNDVYTVKGNGTAFLGFVTAPFKVDLYTCEGLREGTWKGTAEFQADRSVFGELANRYFRGNLPDRISTRNDHVQQRLNLLDESGFPFATLIDPFLKAWFQVDRRPKEESVPGPGGSALVAEHLDGPVGDVELYVGDQSLDTVMELIGVGSATFPIVGVPNDPRCEGGGPDDYFFEGL